MPSLHPSQDAPRPEAREAVQKLGGLGCRVAMLTGDGPGVASAVGSATGLQPEHVHASLLPQHKLEQVCVG